MLKIETHDLIAISLYNDLVAMLEKMRKDNNLSASDYKDLIDGYTLAREMVEHFFALKFISEWRYYSLDRSLHCCTDCPSTHCVPLQTLQLGITLT